MYTDVQELTEQYWQWSGVQHLPVPVYGPKYFHFARIGYLHLVFIALFHNTTQRIETRYKDQ